MGMRKRGGRPRTYYPVVGLLPGAAPESRPDELVVGDHVIRAPVILIVLIVETRFGHRDHGGVINRIGKHIDD